MKIIRFFVIFAVCRVLVELFSVWYPRFEFHFQSLIFAVTYLSYAW